MAGLWSQQAPGQVVISSGAFPLVAGGGKGWCEQTGPEAAVTGWGVGFTLIFLQVASRGGAVFQQSPHPASPPPPQGHKCTVRRTQRVWTLSTIHPALRGLPSPFSNVRTPSAGFPRTDVSPAPMTFTHELHICRVTDPWLLYVLYCTFRTHAGVVL